MADPGGADVNADGTEGAQAAIAAVVAEMTSAVHPWTCLEHLDRFGQIGAFAFLVGALARSIESHALLVGRDPQEILQTAALDFARSRP